MTIDKILEDWSEFLGEEEMEEIKSWIDRAESREIDEASQKAGLAEGRYLTSDLVDYWASVSEHGD